MNATPAAAPTLYFVAGEKLHNVVRPELGY